MLTKFAVQNYRGFSKRIEWNLTNARDYAFNSFAVKNGVIKNGIIYGPNGSGKTNFGLALFDIVNHLSQNSKKPDYYTNFIYAGAQKELVTFEYTFQFEDEKLQSVYSKYINGILIEERLSVNSQEVIHHRQGTLIIDDSFAIDEKVKNNLITANANHVSIIGFLLLSLPLPEDHYLIKLQNFINSMLWFCSLETREFMGLTTITREMLTEYIIKNNLIHDFQLFLETTSEQ